MYILFLTRALGLQNWVDQRGAVAGGPRFQQIIVRSHFPNIHHIYHSPGSGEWTGGWWMVVRLNLLELVPMLLRDELNSTFEQPVSHSVPLIYALVVFVI